MGTIKGFGTDNGIQTYFVDNTFTESDFPPSALATGEAIGNVTNEVDAVQDKIHYKSSNEYDASLQTASTISPHYYVNGVPYSSTQYDASWNCTALFPIEPSVQYTIGLVPAVNSYTKPWGRATSGVFFYDENGTYISGTDSSTFTTPSNATQARFNYNIASGITLNVLNANCMLVKGSALPTTYEAFIDVWIKGKVEQLESAFNDAGISKAINYIIDNDGNGITLISRYSSDYDIAVKLKKKGGNNLFDFSSVGLIPNDTDTLSTSTSGISYLLSGTGDWFAPFKVKANSNGNGDNPTSEYFTGGNHQYNNGQSGSTATARTTTLSFYCDKKLKTEGSGSANIVELVWSNNVQGYNTTKSDGTGREILQEKHRLIFDGFSFNAFVDLIPLEAITISTWYGFQWFTAPYATTRFIGGANRAEVDASVQNETSGNHDCCNVTGYTGGNEISISIDCNYDLGKREYYSGNDSIITRSAYNKGYFNIISHLEAASGDIYSLKGKYTFSAHH